MLQYVQKETKVPLMEELGQPVKLLWLEQKAVFYLGNLSEKSRLTAEV
jgi:hypothetical protein